jgi:hypothetical protein
MLPLGVARHDHVELRVVRVEREHLLLDLREPGRVAPNEAQRRADGERVEVGGIHGEGAVELTVRARVVEIADRDARARGIGLDEVRVHGERAIELCFRARHVERLVE